MQAQPQFVRVIPTEAKVTVARAVGSQIGAWARWISAAAAAQLSVLLADFAGRAGSGPRLL